VNGAARWTLLLGLLGTAAAVACTVEYAQDPVAPPVTNSVDAGPPDVAPTAEAGPRCESALPPPPPATEDGDPVSDNVVTLVARSIRATPDDAGVQGYDLDGVCTCPGPESCQRRELSVDTVVFDRCDAPGGRDNAAAKMILSNAFLGDIFDEGGKGLGTVGGDTFVVELGDYNGGQNDKQVTLALAATNGFRGDADAGADGGPRYDGTDTWDVLDRSLDQGSTLVDAGACAAISRGACVSKSITKDAYVTGGVLVARFDGTLPWPFGGFAGTELDVRRGYLVANLVRSSVDGLRLEKAVLTGRITETDVLDGFGRSLDPLKGTVDGGGGAVCACASQPFGTSPATHSAATWT
jgi:hypothetical protein